MLHMVHADQGLGVCLRHRALAFGRANLRCLAAFGASIADAKEKARAELSGGTRGSSDTGLDTLNNHSGIPQQHPHLRSV
jgi:hypothetical protein